MAIKKMWQRQKKINDDQAENTAAYCEQQILDLMENSSLEFFFLRNEADTILPDNPPSHDATVF